MWCAFGAHLDVGLSERRTPCRFVGNLTFPSRWTPPSWRQQRKCVSYGSSVSSAALSRHVLHLHTIQAAPSCQTAQSWGQQWKRFTGHHNHRSNFNGWPPKRVQPLKKWWAQHCKMPMVRGGARWSPDIIMEKVGCWSTYYKDAYSHGWPLRNTSIKKHMLTFLMYV